MPVHPRHAGGLARSHPGLSEVAPALAEAPRPAEVREQVRDDALGLPLDGPDPLKLGRQQAFQLRDE